MLPLTPTPTHPYPAQCSSPPVQLLECRTPAPKMSTLLACSKLLKTIHLRWCGSRCSVHLHPPFSCPWLLLCVPVFPTPMEMMMMILACPKSQAQVWNWDWHLTPAPWNVNIQLWLPSSTVSAFFFRNPKAGIWSVQNGTRTIPCLCPPHQIGQKPKSRRLWPEPPKENPYLLTLVMFVISARGIWRMKSMLWMAVGCCTWKQEERKVAYKGVCCHDCLIGDKGYKANEVKNEQNGYCTCNGHIYTTHAATNTTIECKQSVPK